MKMKDFEAGRLAGLEMALRIAKKDGVAGLEKELRFRGKNRPEHAVQPQGLRGSVGEDKGNDP